MMGWERGISAFRFLKIMYVAFSGAVVTLSARNGALAMRRPSQRSDRPENLKRWLWSGNCECDTFPLTVHAQAY